jgi:hypothetical protein
MSHAFTEAPPTPATAPRCAVRGRVAPAPATEWRASDRQPLDSIRMALRVTRALEAGPTGSDEP